MKMLCELRFSYAKICKKHLKACCIFNALLLSALAFTYILQVRVPGSQKENRLAKYSKLNNYSRLNRGLEKKKVDQSLRVGLISQTYRHAVADIFKARTHDEARRLLRGYVFDDIMKMEPIRYLDSFKNPCWMGSKDNGPVNDNKIHCLPYFFVIERSFTNERVQTIHWGELCAKGLGETGVKKCGTSDVFARITEHPEVTSRKFKEAQWFTKRRFLMKTVHMSSEMNKALSVYDPRQLAYYIHMFDMATKTILSEREGRNSMTSELITGEATPAYLHLQGVWDLLPGNEGLSEPRYTNLHYIKHLIPQAKIIIIFRNPVDRLYSDFLHSRPTLKAWNASVAFHEQAATMVKIYGNCFRENSFRHCIYNNFTDVYPPIFQPAAGFYAFFMKELRGMFGPSQILPLLFDDYVAKPVQTMSKVYSFLELRSLDTRRLQQLIRLPVRNSGIIKKSKSGPMFKQTRKMLNNFYRSSNEEMAELLGDNRYLFSEI